MEYEVVMDCPECGHENKHRGYQIMGEDDVFTIDPVLQFSQMAMDCEECDTTFGTGDIDVYTA